MTIQGDSVELTGNQRRHRHPVYPDRVEISYLDEQLHGRTCPIPFFRSLAHLLDNEPSVAFLGVLLYFCGGDLVQDKGDISFSSRSSFVPAFALLALTAFDMIAS